MEVILIDDVFEVGRRGQIVRVADGYGRNYLIPKRLAIPATPGNRKMIEQQRLSMAKKEAKYTEEAELLAQELNQLHVLISRKSGDAGTLFGSVTSKDVADLLEGSEIRIDRRKILLQQPIKSIGNHRIEVRLHSEVAAELLLSVLLEGDEPVARIKKKDEESDRIVAELEARIKEMGRSAGSEETPPEAPEFAGQESQPPVTDQETQGQQEQQESEKEIDQEEGANPVQEAEKKETEEATTE